MMQTRQVAASPLKVGMLHATKNLERMKAEATNLEHDIIATEGALAELDRLLSHCDAVQEGTGE
jgi:hypothetical protein